MATIREIQNLLRKINITIDKQDIMNCIITLENTDDFYKEGGIEEILLRNAKYIDFKKLLIIAVKSRQELTNMYRQQNISPLLERESKQELEKIIKFAKAYIKPEEFIKVEMTDYEDNGRPVDKLVDSKTVIYNQKLGKRNEAYAKIKNKLPNIDLEECVYLLGVILEDETLGNRKFWKLIDKYMRIEGIDETTREEFWEKLSKVKRTEEMQEISKNINKEKFNQYLKEQIENLGPYVNTEKCILFYACYVGTKLEQGKIIDEKECAFLEQLEELLKEIDTNTRIEDQENFSFGKKEIFGVLAKWDKEKREYCTDKELKSGQKLLRDVKGYENYCPKNLLKEFAQIEENLLYLAQTKKLSNSEIYNIALRYPVSEETIVCLYQCGAITLTKIKNYAKQHEINLEQIKEKIKQEKLKNIDTINLNDSETWKLLNSEERLQVAGKIIDEGKGKTIKGRIEELYDVQEIANLYKEIYHGENSNDKNIINQKRKKYNDLIKLHNVLGLSSTDNIVNILEDELSNEMLINLYSDNLIDLNVLESYGEKELVEEVFNQGKIKEEDIRKAIINYPISLNGEEFYQYYQKGILTPKDLLNLYVSDRINLNTIEKINEKLPEEEKIDLQLKEQELAKLYQESKKERKYKNDSQEKTRKYKRYALIYHSLKREGLNEKILLDKQILENIPNFTQEDIIELYKNNLLTLETILTYGGDDLAKKLVKEGVLKTNDARTYFKSKQTDEEIKEILENPEIDETEKMILIYTTYGDDKDERDNLIKYLSAHATDIKGEKTGQKKDGENKNPSKKTVTDPYERWKLFSLLDPNYSKKYVGGYLIVKLHNTQKVIIEKMYEKKNKEIIPAYGTATFTLDIDEYEKIENELVQNKKFNIAKIRKIAKENPDIITKITHHSPVIDKDGKERTSWGKRVFANICNEEESKIYSEFEIAEIEECMTEIEKSRQNYMKDR